MLSCTLRIRIASMLLALSLGALTALPGCDDDPSGRPDAGLDGGPDADLDAGPDADADADTPEPDELVRLATELSIVKISLFQSVEVPFWREGDPFAPAPVVILPDRALRVAVWASWEAGAAPRPVTLTVSAIPASGEPVHLQDEVTFPATTEPADPGTAAFLDLPAGLVRPGLALSVRLLDGTAAAVPEEEAHPARAGTLAAPLSVQVEPERAPVRLVLIPIRYQDGATDYLPDTGEAQLRLYRALLEATYPGAFDLVLHAELAWDDPFTWTGNFDFGDLNGELVDLKASEGDAPESYYYALVAPAESFSAYCGGSCVTGQSYEVSDPASSDYRVGGGMGFAGESSAWTMVHELGHMFGRSHTGCDVSLDDGDFPYDDGMLGSWGLDPRTGAWIDPATTADFMGYCDPTWVSDYTWNGLYERIEALAQLYPPAPPAAVRLVHANLAAGTLRIGALLHGRGRSGRTVRVIAGGRELDAPATFQSGGTAFTFELPADLDPRTLLLPEFPVLSW